MVPVVAYDEFDVGVLRRYDLSYSFRPDGAVHRANALHLEHGSFCVRRGYCALNQSSPLACEFLDIEVLEQRRKVTMPFPDILATKARMA